MLYFTYKSLFLAFFAFRGFFVLFMLTNLLIYIPENNLGISTIVVVISFINTFLDKIYKYL